MVASPYASVIHFLIIDCCKGLYTGLARPNPGENVSDCCGLKTPKAANCFCLSLHKKLTSSYPTISHYTYQVVSFLCIT